MQPSRAHLVNEGCCGLVSLHFLPTYIPEMKHGKCLIVVVTFGFETLLAKTSFINLKQLNNIATTDKVSKQSQLLKIVSKTLCMPLPAEVRLRCVRMGKPPLSLDLHCLRLKPKLNCGRRPQINPKREGGKAIRKREGRREHHTAPYSVAKKR